MSRAKTLPINSDKLKELVLNHGTVSSVSEEAGFATSSLSSTFSRGAISVQMAKLLDVTFGIKYESYKPEEKKEEPIEEKPNAETEVISKDEALLKTIISQLSALNNGLNAIYKKLEQIDADVKVWEE